MAASESVNSITHHPFSKDTLIFLANSKGEEYWNRSDDVG